jgi:putative isomerase
MTEASDSPFLALLHDRVDLVRVPFTERGSRLLVFHSDDGLSVRLAERWFKVHGSLSGYRERPALVDRWRFTDGRGRPLSWRLETWPHRLDLHARRRDFTVVFLDSESLLVALPPGPGGVTFHARTSLGHADRRGGRLSTADVVRRQIAFTTNARVRHSSVEIAPDDGHLVTMAWEAEAGAAFLLNVTPRLGLNRYVPDPGPAIEAAARRWHDWFAAVPPLAGPCREQYYYAWWIMRAGLISTRFYTTREAMTPSKTHYVGVWQWDAFFHALAYRFVDMRLAKDQLRIILDHQREDGMMPDAVHDEGVVAHLVSPVDADVTKPPLIAWVAWKLYQHDGDKEFLDEIYEPLVRWNNWWFERNDLDGNGLCEYQHPFSSGLDDSPLWDGGMPVESPDLNTYLCLQQEALADIATVLGLTADARLWSRQAEATARRMVRWLWDPRAGLFRARRQGQAIDVTTPLSLLPLMTGRLPERITRRLVERLTDPATFWSRYPVPSVALNDPNHDPHQMWRGPTWVNLNYLLMEGLQRCGYHAEAAELRRRTIELIGRHRDIYEYYDPQTGDPPPKAASLFGWSAALFIEMLLQEQAAGVGTDLATCGEGPATHGEPCH